MGYVMKLYIMRNYKGCINSEKGLVVIEQNALRDGSSWPDSSENLRSGQGKRKWVGEALVRSRAGLPFNSNTTSV